MNVSIPDCFMIAFAAGFIFGVVYELIRIVRLILRFRWAVIVCDIVFFILAAMFVCKLSEFLGNYVRLYTVLGFGAGVFTYIETVGRLFNAFESAASIVWRKTLGRLLRKIIACCRKIYKKIHQKGEEIFGKIHEICGDCLKKRQQHLHLSDEMLYNIKGNDIVGEGEKAHVIKATVRKSS